MTWMLSFCAGSLLVLLAPRLPPVPLLVVIAAFSIAGLVGLQRRQAAPRSTTHRVLSVLACLCLGAAWSSFVLIRVLDQRLAEQDLHPTVELIIQIIELPQRRMERWLIVGQVLGSAELEFRGRLRLSWYHPPQMLRVGQCWKLTAKLRPPIGFANPAGFDYEQWLLSQRIGGLGYVRDAQRQHADCPVKWQVNNVRQLVAQQFALQPASLGAALLSALAIGDRSALSAEAWQVLRATGTHHLLAISGLHIGMAAAAFSLFGIGLWHVCAPLRKRLPRRLLAAAASMLGALAYAALAGFSTPTVRALIMLTVVVICMLKRQQLQVWRSWCLAFTCCLIIDPLAPLTSGFWLSFSAVAIILLVINGRLGVTPRWLQAMQLQFALSLLSLPLTVGFFGYFSLVAYLANLVVVPAVSMLVVPLAITTAVAALIVPNAVAPLHALGVRLLEFIWWALECFASFPGAVWELAAVSWFTLAGLALAVFIVIFARKWVSGLLAAALLLPWLFTPVGLRTGEFRLDVLEVGQGLAVVVRTAHHTLLYDTGPRFGSAGSAGDWVVLPALRAFGVRQLDRTIVSHWDSDHAGGLAAIASAMPLGQVLSGKSGPMPSVACRAGQAWEWDSVRFEVLHPRHDNWGDNDASCVLRLSSQFGSALLTGDIERAAEIRLLPSIRPVDVLLAPHHGSASSSSPAFVSAAAPRWVIYSTGRGNRYGFPNLAVQQRYLAIGAVPYNTANAGAIAVLVSFSGIEIRAARAQSGPFWRYRSPAL